MYEVFLVILLVVEPNDPLDIKPFEDLDILIRMMTVSLVRVPLFNGSHKGHELAWDDPVDVSVLDTLKVLILLDVEGFKVVPFKVYSML